MCCLNSKLLVLSLSLFFVFTVAAHGADENEVKSLDELVIEAPMAELRDTFIDFMPIPTSSTYRSSPRALMQLLASLGLNMPA